MLISLNLLILIDIRHKKCICSFMTLMLWKNSTFHDKGTVKITDTNMGA